MLHSDMEDTYHVESFIYTGQGFVVVENGEIVHIYPSNEQVTAS